MGRPDGRSGLVRPSVAEQGSGVVSTVAGVTVFLAFLLFAVQLLTNLYATSVVTGAAYDGARTVAEAAGDGEGGVARSEAEDHMRSLLGRYGERVSFDWRGTDGDVVRLRVTAENPTFLLRALGGRLPFTEIDRTVVVRVERLR